MHKRRGGVAFRKVVSENAEQRSVCNVPIRFIELFFAVRDEVKGNAGRVYKPRNSLEFRNIFLYTPCNGSRCPPHRIKLFVVPRERSGNPVNIFLIVMMLIIAQFVLYIKRQQQAACHANRKSQYIDG